MVNQLGFEEYLKNVVKDEGTITRYSKAINVISNVMIQKDVISQNLYDYENMQPLIEDIKRILNLLKSIPEAIEMQQRTHNLYSCALNHFRNYCEENIKNDNLLPEEIPENQLEHLKEGSTKTIVINAFERNPKARAECIKEYGSQCSICGFDFGKFYGSQFNGKIHVHHIKPLNEIREEYEVNPKTDLIPVCANCHMILHSKYNGTYTKEEVQKFIEDSKLLK